MTSVYAHLLRAVRAAVGIGDWNPVPHNGSLADALGGMFLWNWLIYWLILGAWQAYHYYDRYIASELRLERLEKSLSQARLNALRMQLDPHFLFNALNTISSQLERDPKLARRMIEHLGDLLRLSLESKDRQEVPLVEEMAFLEHYLAIQKIRFGDHLRIETQIRARREICIRTVSLRSAASRECHSTRNIAASFRWNRDRHGATGRQPAGHSCARRRRGTSRRLDSGKFRRRRAFSNAPACGGALSRGRNLFCRESPRCRWNRGGNIAALAIYWKGGPCPLSQSEGLCVMVADDEAPARQRIIDLLRNVISSGSRHYRSLSDGLSAVEIIENRKPPISCFSMYRCPSWMASVSSMKWGQNACH